MGRDGAARLMLIGVLAVAFAGCALWVTGAARRAALADRGALLDDEPLLGRLRASLDRLLRRTPLGARLAAWLAGAGIEVAAADFVAVCAGAALVTFLLCSLLVVGPAALLVSLVATVTVARAWVERRRAARRDRFIAQLPELARVLSNGAAAGLSLPGAVSLAARELPEPAATEMRRVVEELRLGQALELALARLRDRLPSREVSVLVTTLVVQHRAGGDTVRALSELGQTLEARKDLAREIRTLLSGSVFTSYLVAAMGVGSIALVNVISPGVLGEMTRSPVGILALCCTGGLWLLAFLMIRRITRVEP